MTNDKSLKKIWMNGSADSYFSSKKSDKFSGYATRVPPF
jgi:hypothetical protein